MTTIKFSPQIETSHSGKFQYAFVRMFFNGTLCAVTIADKKGYFENKNISYEIWDTWACIDSTGTGMNDVQKFMCDELIIETPFGNYRVRKLRDDDVKQYGCNNFKNIFLEPIA